MACGAGAPRWAGV